MKLEAVLGDITLEEVDAIVNAANSSLLQFPEASNDSGTTASTPAPAATTHMPRRHCRSPTLRSWRR